MRRNWIGIGWIIGAIIFCVACSSANIVNPTTAPARTTPLAMSTQSRSDTPTATLANVDSVQIRTLESFPVQIQVVAKGNLPDSCTTIDNVRQMHQDMAFKITLTTTRPAGVMCAQVLTPYDKVITLDANGLPKGKYEVIVNNATASFELTTDNILASQSDGTMKKIAGEFVTFETPASWNPTKRQLSGGAVLEEWHLGIPVVKSDQVLGFSSVAFNQLRPKDVISEIVITLGGKRGFKWIRQGANYVSYDYFTTGRVDQESFGVHVTLPQKNAEIEMKLDRMVASIVFK